MTKMTTQFLRLSCALGAIIVHGASAQLLLLPQGRRANKGVTFSRTIVSLPSNSSFQMELGSNYCDSRDEYGDNSCHYNWSDSVFGNYSIAISQTITKDDRMIGHFKVKSRIRYDTFLLPQFVLTDWYSCLL
jgi:hypothetical protein